MSRKPGIKVYRHLPGFEVKAEFSDCGNYRYLLHIQRKGAAQGKRVCAIMLNPSVASEEQADKSVQFLEKLVFEKALPNFKGVTDLWITNLYAYIQTKNFKGTSEQVGERNDHYLAAAISAADIILIAWGKSCSHPERQAKVLQLLSRYPDKVLLVTKCHPSRGYYEKFVTVFQP